VAAEDATAAAISQCVYSGSINGSIFMLSIIQLVTPPWAALPDREPAHWSYAMAESRAGTEREKQRRRRTMERGGETDPAENNVERSW